MHLLERDRSGAHVLASSIERAIEGVGHCNRCRTLSETPICIVCSDPERDLTQLCVLENPADMLAIEQTGGFNGGYFVLFGHLSPIDGIGPDDIGIDQLIALVQQNDINELVIATNPTVEGEATAHYIAQCINDISTNEKEVTVSRIAHGIPLGSEIEYVDGGTLAHAFAGRKVMTLS
jgi:recombination protein RecR